MSSQKKEVVAVGLGAPKGEEHGNLSIKLESKKPSQMREELGDFEARLARVQLHLVDDD